jgi:hypothetical protein
VVRSFETGETVVRRDVHRSGRVWSEQALRVLADIDEALVTACAPGAEARWPALYAKARDDGDRSVRTEAFEAMATGRWELTDAVWQETDLLLWKPPAAWFSINAFFVPDGAGATAELVRQLRAPHKADRAMARAAAVPVSRDHG